MADSQATAVARFSSRQDADHMFNPPKRSAASMSGLMPVTLTHVISDVPLTGANGLTSGRPATAGIYGSYFANYQTGFGFHFLDGTAIDLLVARARTFGA